MEDLEECFARVVRREKEREEAERRNFAAREQLRPLEYWLRTLNVGRTTLWRWEQQGKVTPTRIGGKVYYKETDFEFNERKEGRQ